MSHHLIAALADSIRNEFARAHPSLPAKSTLLAKAGELRDLVEGLPDEPAAPVQHVVTGNAQMTAPNAALPESLLTTGVVVPAMPENAPTNAEPQAQQLPAPTQAEMLAAIQAAPQTAPEATSQSSEPTAS